MKTKQLLFISYTYLIVPIIIFLLGWVKLIISIPASLLLIVILIKNFPKKLEEENFITKRKILLVLCLATIICITAGQGGLFYQSPDWHCRNAIFRDLINNEWPVYYGQGESSLVYYIGVWIVPAVIRENCVSSFWSNCSMGRWKYSFTNMVFNGGYINNFMGSK